MTGDWGRRSKGRIQQEQGLPILSTRFCKSSAWTLLHTALPVSEHCDESIAVRRRELRSCGYSISPPSVALTIARMLARIAFGNVGQAATIRARSGSAGGESGEDVSETFSSEVRQPSVQPDFGPFPKSLPALAMPGSKLIMCVCPCLSRFGVLTTRRRSV